MKGPQVAGLTLGWLAVALSMAALGTASLAHVGVGTGESQPQVTVTRTISVEKSAPSTVAAPDIAAALSAPAHDNGQPASVVEYVTPFTPSRTTSATPAGTTSSADPQVAPTGSPAPVAPVLDAPGIGALPPGGTAAATSPSASEPTDDGATAPSGTKTTTAPSPTVVAVTLGTWHHKQGTIWAGCRGSSLVSVDATANDGYQATTRTSLALTAVTFVGPTTVSVRVGCTDGTPSFSILR